MPNNPDDKAPGAGGDPKRPYATLDLKATEVPSADEPIKAEAAAEGAGEKRGGTQEPSAAGMQPPFAGDAELASEREGLGLGAGIGRLGGMLPSLLAGIAGALLVLISAEMLSSERDAATRQTGVVADLSRRIAELENTIGFKSGTTGLRARLDELTRTVGTVNDAQARLANDARSLAARVGGPQDIPPAVAERLTKIEEMLATLPSSQGAEPSPAAKTLLSRIDAELSALRTEAGRIGQRIDTLKGESEERLRGAARASDLASLTARLSATEKELQALSKGEADRTANASRVVLLLELGSLKRVLESGKSYAPELAAVQKAAGNRLNLASLERHAGEGVPPQSELAKSFRRVANSMLDAESEPADATLVDRLLAGARSVVRVRKVGQPADDMSAEAVIGRMETALKEGNLAEVIVQAKKLPPKAQLAGEEWVKKVEARHAVDMAIANIEASLKASLGEAQR